MASLSTVIQGLLVAQLPEYEISNDAIGYLCNFSEKLLLHLINKAQHHTDISAAEVKASITSTFPSEWSELILSNATAQLVAPHAEERDSVLKQEISDFELIDDGHVMPEVERRASGNLFLSADFIKCFLPSAVASRLDSDGRIYLSVSVESVLSKFIQQARVALQQHRDEDQMAITQRALVEAIQEDVQLAQLARTLHLYSNQVTPEFEPIEDETPGEQVGNDDVKEAEKALEQVHEEEKRSDAITEAQASERLLSQAREENSTVFSTASVVEEDHVESSIESSEEQLLVGSDKEGHSTIAPQIINHNTITTVVEPPVVSEAPDQELASVYIHLPLPAANASNLARVRKPVVDLYGRCCPYFDISTFAIHMLSSIMELFIRNVICETSIVTHTHGHAHGRVLRQHAREAVRRLTTFQSRALDDDDDEVGGHSSDGNLFNECVSSSVRIMPRTPEWGPDAESYVAEMILYISSRILLVASAHARLAGLWIINSQHIADASKQLFHETSPIVKLIRQLNDQNAYEGEGEGPMVLIPSAPRVRAVEMIYLSSIIKETPLQLEYAILDPPPTTISTSLPFLQIY